MALQHVLTGRHISEFVSWNAVMAQSAIFSDFCQTCYAGHGLYIGVRRQIPDEAHFLAIPSICTIPKP